MPTVYRIALRTTSNKDRGKFRATLTAKEGTYALSVPQSVLGRLMYQIAKQRPLVIDLGRRSAVQVDLNIKGIRPVGKTARKVLTYKPLSKPRPRKKKKETQAPPPKIDEVTSAVFTETATAGGGGKKRSRNKKAVATAA